MTLAASRPRGGTNPPLRIVRHVPAGEGIDHAWQPSPSTRRPASTRARPTPAVDELDLEIGDGEFLVLVGPSGCGKSTSLRMLAGLEDVNGGAIRIGDRDVTDLPPKDRDIAMVFQNYALYPHMTVARQHGLRAQDRRRAQGRDRASGSQEAAKLLDLEAVPRPQAEGALRWSAPARRDGPRDRARSPQVFLMDEPLSNLDAKLRVQTRTQIAALQRRLGVTTVYVTHDQVEAMTMGDRVAVLKDGLLQQVDTPRQLYDHPNNVFVAGFIGSPADEPLRGRRRRRRRALRQRRRPDRRESSTRRPARAPRRSPSASGPRTSTIVDEGRASRSTVNLVEELGADAYVYGDCRGRRQARTTSSPGSTAARRRPRARRSTSRRQARATSHVFSTVTGERLSTPEAAAGRGRAHGPAVLAPWLCSSLAAPAIPPCSILPWDTPLEDWPADQLVALPRGISRHVVRFVRIDGVVYAVKEIGEHAGRARVRPAARRSSASTSRASRRSASSPAATTPTASRSTRRWSPGTCSSRCPTARCSPRRCGPTRPTGCSTRCRCCWCACTSSGFFWGDCSLSNTLFRRDAGAFAAYLVDAETGELHEQLSDGPARARPRARPHQHRRRAARPRGRRPAARVDRPARTPPTPSSGATTSCGRSCTAPLIIDTGERYRIDEQVRRLNDLGFDVAELEIITESDGTHVRVQPKVVDAGHHTRRLLRLTGLDVQENQARRLLNDLDAYRARHRRRRASDEEIVAHRWVAEVFEPVVRAGAHASCAASSSRPRSSTRCSSTAGSCPSRRAGTSGCCRRRGPTSPTC